MKETFSALKYFYLWRYKLGDANVEGWKITLDVKPCVFFHSIMLSSTKYLILFECKELTFNPNSWILKETTHIILRDIY